MRPLLSPPAFIIDSAEGIGYEKLPPLDESVAAHLCLPTAIGWKAKVAQPSHFIHWWFSRSSRPLHGRVWTRSGHFQRTAQRDRPGFTCQKDHGSGDRQVDGQLGGTRVPLEADLNRDQGQG